MAGRPKKAETMEAKASVVEAEEKIEVEVEEALPDEPEKVEKEEVKEEVKVPKKEKADKKGIKPEIEADESSIPTPCKKCEFKFDTAPCKSCVVKRRIK